MDLHNQILRASDGYSPISGDHSTPVDVRNKLFLWMRKDTWVRCPFCQKLGHPCFKDQILPTSQGDALITMCRNDQCHQYFNLLEHELVDRMGLPIHSIPRELLLTTRF